VKIQFTVLVAKNYISSLYGDNSKKQDQKKKRGSQHQNYTEFNKNSTKAVQTDTGARRH